MSIKIVQHLPELPSACVAFWWSNIANGYRIQLQVDEAAAPIQAPTLIPDRASVVGMVESLATQYRVPAYEIDIPKMDTMLRVSQ